MPTHDASAPRGGSRRVHARRRSYEDAGRALGTGLAAAVLVGDPAVVVLRGGVVNSGHLLVEPARAVVRERSVGGQPVVRVAELAEEASLYGATTAAADLPLDRS